ncbi:disease resistance protein L6-like [Nymphaea colorata]|nr:disease resistance protein L6-like [Nymphaea colorata]
MSSSSTPGFQVFLSFRGPETRNGFTSHLSHALKQSGIRTFLDEEDLQKGERITETICRAIEGSAICIPVLSQSYADSSWCLMELAMMVNCNKKIIPIFYDVEPTVVRHQSSSYKAAFDRHRLRFDEKTINEWKGALKGVAEISGYDRRNTANGNEAKLVSMVVERVSRELKKETSSGCSIDPEETESDAELQAIEEKLRQQKDPYLMELELHRKQYEMHVKQKMRISSSADRENLKKQLDAFLKQIHQMKMQHLLNHMAP